VWSLGVILYQLIYGCKPTHESIDALLAKEDDNDEGIGGALHSFDIIIIIIIQVPSHSYLLLTHAAQEQGIAPVQMMSTRGR